MIKQENFCIRTVEEKDLIQIHKSNCQVMRGDFQEFQFSSLRELEKEFEKDGFCNDTFQMLIIEEKEKIRGLLYLNFYRQGIVNIGLVLLPEFCNLGNGKLIVQLMVKYIFYNYPIVRIEADTDIDNKQAQRVLEQNGFEKEGILKKYRYHHGSYRDSLLFSLVR